MHRIDRPTRTMNVAKITSPRLSVEALCRKYHNESLHTEHVTRLALRLFDATRERLSLPEADRPVLEAAARLHDVGYGANPRGHRIHSAAIVRHEGLEGFDDEDRALVVATMLFHSGDFDATRHHPLVAALLEPDRARRLGALLRIADGLDYGHLQDAAIVGVRSGPGPVRVRVRSPLFPNNLARAGEKADLWRATFPVGLKLVPVAIRQATVKLLTPDLSVLESARRLIMCQIKIVAVNAAGALRPEDAEPLHDVRVAIRRLRAALRAFRQPLAPTAAERIDGRLRQMNRALGPARDLDVWIAFLNRARPQSDPTDDWRWTVFVHHEMDNRRRQQLAVRRYLNGPSWTGLRTQLGRLARWDIPRLQETAAPGSLAKLARGALRKSLRQAFKVSPLRRSDQAEDLHRLRIALRRARYAGEYFAPVLGPPFDKLTRRIHAAEQVLARIHDTDVGLARVQRGRPAPPRWLAPRLERRRRHYLARLANEWDRLARFAARRDVRRGLRWNSA